MSTVHGRQIETETHVWEVSGRMEITTSNRGGTDMVKTVIATKAYVDCRSVSGAKIGAGQLGMRPPFACRPVERKALAEGTLIYEPRF